MPNRFATRRGTQNLNDQVAKVWPTPTAMDSEQAGGKGSQARGKRGASLDGMAKTWPTPTVGDAVGAGSRNCEGSKAHSGLSLTDAATTGSSKGRGGEFKKPREVKPKPGTPTQQDLFSLSSRPDPTTPTPGAGSKSTAQSSSQPSKAKRLSVPFVEWLQGMPLGWTSTTVSIGCERLGTWQRACKRLVRLYAYGIDCTDEGVI